MMGQITTQYQKNVRILIFAIDLDRVAIDCDERFVQAEKQYERGSTDYWQAALDPDKMLLLDCPLPGAIEHLSSLARRGILCYVTSRPRSCCQATVTFLSQHGYPFPELVICRPVRKGLTTVRFKRRSLRALSYGLPAQFIHQHFWLATNRVTLFFLSRLRRPETIFFVDDSDKNRQAIADLGNILIAASLDEAIARL
jgi:hypothetical protein